MTDHFTALEQRLLLGYQAQLRQYGLALRIVAQPALDSAGSHESADRVRELNQVLHDITALDNAMAEDKTVWRFSERRAGAQLSQVLASVAESIRTLSAIVDGRAADLQARMQALVPEVDQHIQQRRMLHAYGKRS